MDLGYQNVLNFAGSAAGGAAQPASSQSVPAGECFFAAVDVLLAVICVGLFSLCRLSYTAGSCNPPFVSGCDTERE